MNHNKKFPNPEQRLKLQSCSQGLGQAGGGAGHAGAQGAGGHTGAQGAGGHLGAHSFIAGFKQDNEELQDIF